MKNWKNELFGTSEKMHGTSDKCVFPYFADCREPGILNCSDVLKKKTEHPKSAKCQILQGIKGLRKESHKEDDGYRAEQCGPLLD